MRIALQITQVANQRDNRLRLHIVFAVLLCFSFWLCAEAGSRQEFGVTAVNDEIYLHVPIWVFGRTLYWYTSEEGLSYISLARAEGRVQVHSPKLPAAHGRAFSVDRSGEISANQLQPLVAEMDEVRDAEGRIRVSVSDLLLKDIAGISGFGVVRKDVRPFEFEGAKVEVDGIDLWGSLRSLRKAGGSGYDYSGATQTVRAGLSIVVPDDVPMNPRQFDHRLGYFFDNTFAENGNRTFLYPYDAPIRRWKLEPKARNATASDPVRAIRFHFSPDVPEFAKPALRRALEDWESAFLEAGFTNALELVDLPTDVAARGYAGLRYPIVSWSDRSKSRRTITPEFSGIHAGGGVSVITDIRTGQIIWSEVSVVWPPETAFQFYVAACGVNDPRILERPLHDEVRTDIMQTIATHEFGHAFGLRDGNFGEYAYRIEDVRDSSFLEESGFSPSVMNYTRCNYVAQPEDKVPVSTLLQGVGPADRHQVTWGYIHRDPDLDHENLLSLLNDLADKGTNTPWLAYTRFQPYPDATGPQNMNEAVDVIDPVSASRLGLQNHERLLEMLPGLLKDGAFSSLETTQIYFQALVHREIMMLHPMTLIGGYYESYTSVGTRFKPISADIQQGAINFLLEHAFRPMQDEVSSLRSELFFPGEVRRHESYLHGFLVSEMLSVDRLDRIYAAQVEGDHEALSVLEYLEVLRKGIWAEIYGGRPVISYTKQSVQENYLSALLDALQDSSREESNYHYLIAKLVQPSVSFAAHGRSGWRAAVQYDLEMLLTHIDRVLRKTKDAATRGHLSRMRWRISEALYGAGKNGAEQ